MKKLLTLLSAATVAIGLYAADTGTSFEGLEPGNFDIDNATDTIGGATGYWSTNGTVTATVKAALSRAHNIENHGEPSLDYPAQFDRTNNLAVLSINSTFGNTLQRKTTTNNDGFDFGRAVLYFDSLVKFTAFDDDPMNTAVTNDFNGAKIAVWIQEVEEGVQTNLFVRAGHLTDGAKTYDCGVIDDPEGWHRLTIKAIGDIYKETGFTPAFVVFVDNAQVGTKTDDKGIVSASVKDKYRVMHDTYGALFPSMVQSGDSTTLFNVAFDGQGEIDDIVFTETVPFTGAEDDDSVVYIGGDGYPTLADAIFAVTNENSQVAAGSVFKLVDGSVTAETDIDFTDALVSITLDLNGQELNAITAPAGLCIVDSTTNDVARGSGIVNGMVDLGDNSLIYAGTYKEMVEMGDDSIIYDGRFKADVNAGADGVERYAPDGYTFAADEDDEDYLVLVEATEPTWTFILGAADVDGAYKIDDANDLVALQNGVLAGLATAGETFKVTADIDMTGVTGFYGIGWFGSTDAYDDSLTDIKTSAGSSGIPFSGTFDGKGKMISNVTLVKHNYSGVFNLVSGGTVKDLTVSNFVGFAGTANEGGFAIVGATKGTTVLQNLTMAGTFGSSADLNHNSAGMVIRAGDTTTITGCVNYANIACTAKRVGGIVAFTGDSGSILITDCANYGNLSATGANGGAYGTGGISGTSEASSNLKIENCANYGTVTATTTGNAGLLVGNLKSRGVDELGGNTYLASGTPFGNINGKELNKCSYAVESTINNETYLTTVKTADLAKGNTYTLLTDIAASETPVITLDDAAETIAFKLNGHTFAGTIASSHAGVSAESVTADGVITYTATITDGWAYRLGNAVAGAYEIDNLAELKAFQAGVAAGLATANTTFKLTADIALDGAWDGIGVKGGKDLVNGNGKDIPAYEAGAFCGTFDGQNHTISNFQMENGTDYGAFFNSVNGATISNLKISFKENKLCANSSSTGGDTGASFVGVARGSTLQNLTALAGSVTTVSASKDMAGIVGYLMAGSTVDSCTNELNVASLLTAKARKSGGIALITQDGSGTAIIRNCKNCGTVTLANSGGQLGGIVGYVGVATTIADCENTAAVRMVTHMSGTLTMSGVNRGNATVASCNKAIDGLNFATVDGNVATFVADSALAAGNTYKVMNAAATPTYQLATFGATIAFDESLTAPTAYAITAASGLAADSFTAGNVKTYYAIEWAPAPAEHPWYESPKAVVLAENLPGQTGNIVSAFHGQGEGEYLGLTYSTNPLQFDLYQVDGTNAVNKITSITAEQQPEAGLRGVAISKILGIALTCTYYKYGDSKDGKIYIYTNNLAVALSGSGNPVVVSKNANIAFDAAAFSPDGKYLFSNAVTGEQDNKYYVKWAVSNGGATLTKVGSIAASGRARSMAYARINGRDLVFGLVDTGKVAVIDMTGDDASAWLATDLITDLPAHSYGTLCVSGVKVTGGTPHLTVAASKDGAAVHTDVLNVYALTVPATGAVSASLTKSFNEAAMTAAGFGDISDASRYGNTVYVTEDEATIYFARPDNKLYAAQYVEPAPAGEDIEPGKESQTTYTTQAEAEAALENVTIKAPAAVADNENISSEAKEDYVGMFEKKVVSVGEGQYKIEVALTTVAETTLEAQVDTDAAEVIDDLSESTVTLTTTPGFYYSFEYGTTLNNMTEGARTLATGTTLELARPTTENATSGFYKVLINVTPTPAQD